MFVDYGFEVVCQQMNDTISQGMPKILGFNFVILYFINYDNWRYMTSNAITWFLHSIENCVINLLKPLVIESENRAYIFIWSVQYFLFKVNNRFLNSDDSKSGSCKMYKQTDIPALAFGNTVLLHNNFKICAYKDHCFWNPWISGTRKNTCEIIKTKIFKNYQLLTNLLNVTWLLSKSWRTQTRAYSRMLVTLSHNRDVRQINFVGSEGELWYLM